MTRPRPGKFIAAVRTDGLGCRLGAMMIGMALSETLSLPFRFAWEDNKKGNPHHAVRSAADTFHPDFLQSHFIGDLSGAYRLSFPELLDDAVPAGCFNSSFRPSSAMMTHLQTSKILSSGLRPFFDRIDFAPEVSDVVREAMKMDMPAGAVGVHLRAGDVVYGNFRRTGLHTDKVIAYPVAVELIRSLTREAPVVVFAQDAALGAYVRDRCGVLLSSDLLSQDLSALQHALCDIVLMSRCERIFAGRSGFASAAALIAGSKAVDPAGLMAPEEFVATIRAASPVDFNETSVSRQQKAYASLQALVMGWGFLSYEDGLELVALARNQDPENLFLPLLGMLLHLRNDQPVAADRELEELTLPQRNELARVVQLNFRAGAFRKHADRMGYGVILRAWRGRCLAADHLSSIID